MPIQDDYPENSLLIYCPRITPRILYTFSVFFNHLGQLPHRITSDLAMAQNHDGPLLNYSNNRIEKGLHFPPSNLLFEREVNDFEPEAFSDQEMVGAFPSKENRFIAFDLFASAFYLVTRYEEYLPHLGDLYNRFNAHYSFAHKHHFLQRPMVNHYANFLFDLLEKKFTNLTIERSKYHFINSIDIDNAWAYKEKGLVRTTGGMAKDVVTGNVKNLRKRLVTLFGKQKDPYDNYAYLKQIQEKYNFKSLYFFLLADYGLNDKNVPYWNTRFRSLIQSIADYAEVGIHPGFGSNTQTSKLKEEIKRLNLITRFEITKSRQHFLILNLPETYRRLIQNDITDDYSMGFATEAGFRASICTPYPFYDLDREEVTNLMIHPFTVMDATLKFYMKLNPDEACLVMDRLAEEVKKVNGTFIGLWHNETVSDEGLWKGWRKVYERMIEKAQPL